MKSLSKILQALFFLVAVATVLLVSDWSNRQTGISTENENFRIAVVNWVDAPFAENVEKGLLKGLEEKGIVQGKNLEMDVFKASGDISMLNSIFNQVQTQSYDLVCVSCTPALQTAINTIKNIPVVFTAVADPILAGAGTDFSNHLENITGCNVVCDFESMCRLISGNAPQIKTLGSIYCPGEIISVKFKEQFTEVAAKYGIEVKFFPANNTTELPDAVLGMTNAKIDAVCQMGDNLMSSGISTLIKGVVKANLPYFDYNARPPGSKMESLVQMDVDYFQNGYDAAMQVAQILLEKKSPGEIPFQSPTKVVLELNPEKAKSFGIEFNEETRQMASVIVGEKESFNRLMRIAIVHFNEAPDCEDVTTGILQRYAELGHKEDYDFSFDEYNANTDVITLNDIVKVVAERKYDLIFSTVLGATQALSSKIANVPILFTVVADPVGNGLGESYTNHKTNLAGIDGLCYTGRAIDLMKLYLPDAKKVGVLFCPGEMASVTAQKELEKSCTEKGIQLISVPVNSVSEVSDATISLITKKVDAICQVPDNCTIPGFASMVKITQKEKVPLFCFITSQVEMGAIAAIAGDYLQQGREIADMSIEVINGKSPADIPFSRIKQIKTVINPDAAKAYGIATPQSVYEIADQVIKN